MKVGFEPEPDEVGERVDVVLARRAGVTRVRAQRALRSGEVTVSGERSVAARRLAPGDVVSGDIELDAERPPTPEDIPVAVRYADERVLVISKPAGLVTHPAPGHDSGTLVNALLGLGVPLAGAASQRPGIVHRLDRDTSGLLIVAKDDAAQAALVDAIQRRLVERRYLALVRGSIAAGAGTVDAPIGRHPVRRQLMAVVPSGRRAVTHYEVAGRGPRATLVTVRLETGRTHQIRVHLAHIGHPVVGDRAYGGGGAAASELGLTRLFLHATELRFPHPDGGEVAVSDPLPPDLAAALAAEGLPDPTSG